MVGYHPSTHELDTTPPPTPVSKVDLDYIRKVGDRELGNEPVAAFLHVSASGSSPAFLTVGSWSQLYPKLLGTHGRDFLDQII